MRKFTYVLLAILLMVGVAYAGTPALNSAGDILGQGKYPSDAHKIFRLVRYVPATYSGAAALSADSIVIWDLTSDDGVTVTTTTTSYDSAVAGIIVVAAATGDTGFTAAESVGRANWTWLQTYGLSSADVTSGTAVATAGMAMGTGNIQGEVAPFFPSTTNALLQGKAGFFYDSAAADAAEVDVFLNLD